MSMKLRSKISAALVAFGIIPSVIVAAVTFYTAWTLKRNQAFLITETARAGAHSIERQMRQTAVGVKPSAGPSKPDSPPAGTGPANSAGNQIASAYAEVSQQLGDYVLAHGYVREDHVLDEELPLWVPIPALAEIQVALEQAVADVTGLQGSALKSILRTGTVASTDNRNWELLPDNQPQRRFSQSRAVALDMESATIAANGFRFRVPYGTLLCVSDKPLHGEIKLPGMANHFYRERVDQHLRIGMRAIELMRERGLDQLHSRKLRSFAEVAFQ